MSVKATKRVRTFAEKEQIIREVEANLSEKRVHIAKRLGIPVSTLHTIYNGKDRIRESINKCGAFSRRKSYRKSHFEELEMVLIRWFGRAKATNLKFNGVQIREKAMQIAERLGIGNFHASNGWIDRFRKRHGIAYKRKKLSGEQGGYETGTTEALGGGPSDQIDVKEETSHLEEFNTGTRNLDEHLASVKIEISDSGEDVKSPELQQEEPAFFVTIPGRSSALPVDVSLEQHNKEEYSFPFSSVTFQEPSTSEHQCKRPVRGECKRNSHPQFQFVDVDDNERSLLVLSQVQGLEILRKELPSTEGETAELFSHALNSDTKSYSPIQIYNTTSPSTLDPVQSSQSSNSQLLVCYQPSHQCSPATVSEFCPSDPVRTTRNQLKAVSSSLSPQVGESHIGQTTRDTHPDPILQETSQINDVQVLHRRILELEMQIEKFKQQIAVRDEKKCGPLCQLISMETLQAHLLNTGLGAVISPKSQQSLATNLFPNGCTAPIAVKPTRNSDVFPGSEDQPNRAQEDSLGNSYGTSTTTSLVTVPPVNHQLASITALGKKQNTHNNEISTKVLQAQLAKKYCYEKSSYSRFNLFTRKKAIVAHNKKNREKKVKKALQTIKQRLNSRVPKTETQPSNST